MYLKHTYNFVFPLMVITFMEHIMTQSEDCFVYINGVPFYNGTHNLTESNRTCQRWDATVPHIPVFPMGPEHHNYCRAPDNDARLWCVTTDPTLDWEYCDIPECPASTTLTLSTDEISTATTSYDDTTTNIYSTSISELTTKNEATTTNSYLTTNNEMTSTISNDETTTTNYFTTSNNRVTTSNNDASTTNSYLSTTDHVTTAMNDVSATSDDSTTNSYVTSDQQTIPITTQSVIQSTSNTSLKCQCTCDSRKLYWLNYYEANLTDAEKYAILEAEKNRIQTMLILDKTILTSYKRARTSAEDHRTSAKSIGAVGVIILVAAFMCIVILDTLTFCPTICSKTKPKVLKRKRNRIPISD